MYHVWGQNWALDPLELELGRLWITIWVPGIEHGPSVRATSALKLQPPLQPRGFLDWLVLKEKHKGNERKGERLGCSGPPNSRNGDGACINKSFTWGRRLKDVRKSFIRCGRIQMEKIYEIFALGKPATFDRKKKHLSYICACVWVCTHECSAYGGPRRELAPLGLESHDTVSC